MNFEWIKCSERLPDKSGHYFTASEELLPGVVGVRNYSDNYYSAKYQKWNHFDSQGEDFEKCINNVEYWAEIPEVKV